MFQNSHQNTMAPSAVFCLSLIGCIVLAQCNTVNLFGADPAGGLWGARVDTTAGSEATKGPFSGYQSKFFNKTINIASFDAVTKKVLFHTAKPSALYYGPLCAANRKSPRFLTDLEVVPLNDPSMGDCVNCMTSAFAVHDGVIYFLLFGEYMASNIFRVVELRSFVPCDECGNTGKKLKGDFTYLDVVKCSKLEVTIMKEEFTFNDYDGKEVKGGMSMKVVPKGAKLSFFFQLGNITHSDNKPDRVNISLWYADTAGTVKELHSEVLAPRYSNWDMRALGSVDFMDDNVCWSAGDRLQCAEFRRKGVKNVVEMVMTGEAASSQVCQGPELDHTAVVSGVAISETGSRMSVVFGCFPQSSGTGGTGIVTIDERGEKSIQPVGTSNGPLYAGSVFLTKGFDEACTWEPEFKICLGMPDPNETTPEPKEEPTPEGEPEGGNEIGVDPEEETKTENGIEGGHENKGHEETKAVVGDNAASSQRYYLATLISCFITFQIACLLS